MAGGLDRTRTASQAVIHVATRRCSPTLRSIAAAETGRGSIWCTNSVFYRLSTRQTSKRGQHVDSGTHSSVRTTSSRKSTDIEIDCKTDRHEHCTHITLHCSEISESYSSATPTIDDCNNGSLQSSLHRLPIWQRLYDGRTIIDFGGQPSAG